MHEMSLAEGMLQLMEDAARKEGFRRVKTVWLEIGRLAAVEVEALRFCFDAVTRGSLAEGARLEIIEQAARGRCLQCACEVPLTQWFGDCPYCGSARVQMTSGTEMVLRELEVE